ncbi:hypothetical protein IKF32_00220 [Candidatus Saccharibacteria bacterium]|nr:hypothetical protein [Candidatus Saccharibacteria bacterium]
MEKDYLPKKDWVERNKIVIDTVLKDRQTSFLYFCSHVIPYNGVEYLYFSSYDFKDIVICVQVEKNGEYFVRKIVEEPEWNIALELFKTNYGKKASNEF